MLVLIGTLFSTGILGANASMAKSSECRLRTPPHILLQNRISGAVLIIYRIIILNFIHPALIVLSAVLSLQEIIPIDIGLVK